MAGKRSIDQIRADMAATRDRVTESVQGLVTEVDPRVLKNRAIDSTKSFVMGEATHVKRQFVDESGPRWGTITKVVGGIVLVVAVAVVAQAITGAQNKKKQPLTSADALPVLTKKQVRRIRKQIEKFRAEATKNR